MADGHVRSVVDRLVTFLMAIHWPRAPIGQFVEQLVTILTPGVGITDCLECAGAGDWTPFVPWEAEPGSVPCVNCKGSGKIHVDAWAPPEGMKA
jgi:hypothetical protein